MTKGGKNVHLGLGFAERADSFDLNTTLHEHFKGILVSFGIIRLGVQKAWFFVSEHEVSCRGTPTLFAIDTIIITSSE